jgi:hypothetical protein
MPTSHAQQIAQEGKVIVVVGKYDDHMGIDPFLRDKGTHVHRAYL